VVDAEEMMKPTSKKKLALATQTVRSLQDKDLQTIVGGQKFGSDRPTHCGGSDCLIPVEI
jgi:hypothetical protein